MNRKHAVVLSAWVAAMLLAALSILLYPASASAADPCPQKPRKDTDCALLWEQSLTERSEVITYTVQSGDTMWGIAMKFKLDVDTLRYSNPDLYRNPDRLYVGQVVRIPPFPGAIYKVKEGDTLESIAKKWHASPEAIIRYKPNHVSADSALTPGQELVIPGGRLDLNIPKPDTSPEATFAWPLRGWLTQGYSARHRAVDIATAWGAPVYAAGDGRVIRAGWLFTGYGFSVIIRHPNGLVTLYSHMTNPAVKTGDWVRRGQQIGVVGSTGNSTGPHVHFEVRKNGIRVNPLTYLPALPPH
jgi:murein DD-endopeptidase MepM/ murein hydrolase activator NlpD